MSRTSRWEWAKRVERWKDSGLSAKEYAAEIGVKPTTLSYWSWKLKSGTAAVGSRGTGRPARRGARRRRAVADCAAPRFVELGARQSVDAAPALDLVLRSGVVVRVTAGFDEATLTRVVRAVEAAR